MDGMGYTVDLRGVNFTCSGQCTARVGDRAQVIQTESPFSWNSTLTVAWSGVYPSGPFAVWHVCGFDCFACILLGMRPLRITNT